MRGFHLQDENAFDPETVAAMATALEQVCVALEVKDDRTREVVAIRIIELASRGERDAVQLRDHVLRDANGQTTT